MTPFSHMQCRLGEKLSVFSSTDKKRKLSVAARPDLLNFKTEAVQVDVYTYSCTHGCTRVYFATVCTTVLVLIRKKNARAGARPFYLPHAKQTFYHLSYDWQPWKYMGQVWLYIQNFVQFLTFFSSLQRHISLLRQYFRDFRREKKVNEFYKAWELTRIQ